jgi:hypothetical protein
MTPFLIDELSFAHFEALLPEEDADMESPATGILDGGSLQAGGELSPTVSTGCPPPPNRAKRAARIALSIAGEDMKVTGQI